MRRPILAATACLIALLALFASLSAAHAQGHAEGLIWQVENPFRLFKSTSWNNQIA